MHDPVYEFDQWWKKDPAERPPVWVCESWNAFSWRQRASRRWVGPKRWARLVATEMFAAQRGFKVNWKRAYWAEIQDRRRFLRDWTPPASAMN